MAKKSKSFSDVQTEFYKNCGAKTFNGISDLYISGVEEEKQPFINKDFPIEYTEPPKRSFYKFQKDFFTPKISLPKESFKTLKNFFLNYKDYEEFMRIMLNEDEFDCWQYQAERIYKMFKEQENEN